MMGKFILPWFGGGPSVWTVSMLFFQTLLLGGYGYADRLSRLPARRQALVHLAVLTAALLWLALSWLARGAPITPDPRLKPPGGASPVGLVMLTLAASVGIPYLLLSTTSSLGQAWYRAARRQASPYTYYALSNAASFLALLSYPTIIEPYWTIGQQARFWSFGFGIYLVMMSGLAAWMLRNRSELSPVSDPLSGAADAEDVMLRPERRDYLAWIGLAGCASVLLLSVTNQITQDVASVPFLWVLPLSLYLLSFILTFNNRFARLRNLWVILTPAALALGLLDLDGGVYMTIPTRVALNGALLLIISLLCHAELYARRPHPSFLTTFYLMVSIGGALGGVLVGIIAPLVFNDFWEYPLAVALSGAIATMIAFHSRGHWIHRLRWPIAVSVFILAVWMVFIPFDWVWGTVKMTRNFYGVLRVRAIEVDGSAGHNLVHGGVLHGSQVLESPYRFRPTRYYTPTTGIGLAYQFHPAYTDGEPMRVGVVGLGIGTIAAYGRTGDHIRFYEIDPDVVAVAQDDRYFTYLADSHAEVDIVLGDARLSLERELAEQRAQNYNLLAIDAFSGDSIPTHLINRDAVAVYLAHLAEDGVLAFHISNRHINLEPVTALLAEHFGLTARVIHGGKEDWEGSNSTWVLLARNSSFFDIPVIRQAAQSPEHQPGIRLWTDDYSNLFQLLWD